MVLERKGRPGDRCLFYTISWWDVSCQPIGEAAKLKTDGIHGHANSARGEPTHQHSVASHTQVKDVCQRVEAVAVEEVYASTNLNNINRGMLADAGITDGTPGTTPYHDRCMMAETASGNTKASCPVGIRCPPLAGIQFNPIKFKSILG